MSHQRPDADNESAPMLSRGGDEVAAQRADEEAFSGGSSSRKVGGGAGLYNNRQLRAPPSERWSPQRWALKAVVAAVLTVGAVELSSRANKETPEEMTIVRIGWCGNGGNGHGGGGREAWLAQAGFARGTREEKGEGEGSVLAGDAANNASSFSSPYASLQPPEWDSTACMGSWGLEGLQREEDPAGYIIWVGATEQLGGVQYSLSDGLFIARTLNRTLVEFPAERAQIGHPNSKLGCGAYWDFDRLCRYHRILGLGAFRRMIGGGLLDVDDFVTMTPRDEDVNPMKALKTENDVRRYFGGYESSKVIVMLNQWKSHIRREPMDFLQPLPFYDDVARRLIDEQPGWQDRAFLAVQWRTETSSGNLTVCYCHVREAVEEFREREGLGREQVYFNTDLVANASDTYGAEKAATRAQVLNMIEDDYPAATNNSVSVFLGKIEDLGVRSIASGVVAASAKILLASTTRSWAMHRGACQKIHSKFIDLVMEWRQIYGPVAAKETEDLFPVFYMMGSRKPCS